MLAVFTVTNLNDAGPGSLRQAILDANAAPGPDAIEFDAAAAGTINLTSGELTITDALTVNGPGPNRLTIDANERSRVFNINDGTDTDLDVELNGVTITGGRPISNGGGILTFENLSVTNSTISGNTAGNAVIPDLLNHGGGIHASGDATVNVIGSTISGNTASAYGGGIHSLRGAVTITDSTISGNTAGREGGALYTNGELTITNSTISGNTTEFSGGGIYARYQTVNVINSTISNNTANRDGGGIATHDANISIINSTISGNAAGGDRFSRGGGIRAGSISSDFDTTVTVAGSTISGNTTGGRGGGMYVDSQRNVIVTVTNSTISGNTAGERGGGSSVHAADGDAIVTVADSTVSGNTSEDRGGGSFIFSRKGDAVVTLADSTISGNSANNRGGGIYALSDEHDVILTVTSSTVSGNTAGERGGGIYAESSSGEGDLRMTVTGSILSGNTAESSLETKDFGGSGFDANHSLIGNAAAALLDGGDGNVIDDNPRLSPLADNGGPTQTLALLPGSPAIDAGDPHFAPPPEYDQRGSPFNRVVNGRIDIGAYEFGASNPADLTGDGFVDFEDLTLLLAAWNQNVSAAEGNLVDAASTPVNFEDLTVLLAAWTGPRGAASPQAAVGSERPGPLEQVRMNPVTTSAPQAAIYELSPTAQRRTARRTQSQRDPSPFRRLQAASVDRAMADQHADEPQRRDMISPRRIRRGR